MIQTCEGGGIIGGKQALIFPESRGRTIHVRRETLLDESEAAIGVVDRRDETDQMPPPAEDVFSRKPDNLRGGQDTQPYDMVRRDAQVRFVLYCIIFFVKLLAAEAYTVRQARCLIT